MDLSELLEDSNKDLVIIYPGRFHPFHIGHGKVYKYLKQKYSNAKVFISTTDKTDGDRSPFTFEEKKRMMELAGVDSSAIVQCKSPYQSIEIVQRFDEDKTVVVFAVSEKDMAEEPRFDFSGGIKLKKNGEPAYMQKWTGLDSAETYRKHGYLATTPTFPFEVLGQEINSASQIRNMITTSDDTKLNQILQDLYNKTDIPKDVIEIFKRKIGNKETMNENWSEYSLSEFLIEIEYEDKKMKNGILKSITEGYGPMTWDRIKSIAADIKDYVDDHKEHFDAYPQDVEVDDKIYDWDEYWKILDKVYPEAYDNQYAVESVDAEFDRKITGVLKEKPEEELNEILPALAVGAAAAAVGTAAYKGGKALHNWMSKKNSNKNSSTSNVMPGDGMAKSAANTVQTRKNQMNKNLAALKNEGEEMDRPYICVHAVRGKTEVYAPSSHKAAKEAAAKWGLKSTAGINAYLADVEHVAEDNGYANEQHEQLEYIHHVLQECGDGNMDITMVEQALEYVEDIREQHFNADGSTKSESVSETQAQADAYHNETLTKLVNKLKDMHDTLQWTRDEPSSGNRGSVIDDILDEIKEVMDELSHLKGVFPNKWYNPVHKESVEEAQVLAHGGKGQYKAVSDGGVVRIMHKGKEIASGDFDSGADGWFVSREDDKGQKFFSNAQDMVDFFAEQKVNEWVQDQDAGNWSMWTAQERSFIQELCLRHDGVGKDPAGLKYLGKSELWDEGNILKDKGKLTTLMLWVKKNKHDIENYYRRLFRVYSDGNDKGHSGRGQSDGNQILQNIIGKIGKVDGVTEAKVEVDNEGNIAGYLDTIDEYVLMLFKNKELPLAHKNEVAYRIQNAVDDIRTRELGLKPSNVRASYANESKVDEWSWKKPFKFSRPDVVGKSMPAKDSYGREDVKTIKLPLGNLKQWLKDGVNQDQSSESIEQMQDTYKYNEDRNNHSENILMLAHAFGDRGEIRAVEGLLKIIKRQGYVTPEQNKLMYNAIHKKYIDELFPERVTKVKESLSTLIDRQKKIAEAGILHYSDAKGTPKYSEGYKAAKDGVKYDENPYSGAEKLQWSKGHNDWRADELAAKGEPNYGARGQFE